MIAVSTAITASTADNWIGLALAVVAILYLVAVLIWPERF